jgi:preprotein translocase subunit SecA
LRKNVLKYDDVLRKQREIIYKERRDVLVLESIEDQVRKPLTNSIKYDVQQFVHQVGKNQFEIDDDNIIATFNGNIFNQKHLKKTIEKMDEIEVKEHILNLAKGT